MRNWPHAPNRSATPPGAYMITVGTYGKARLLDSPAKLDLHTDMLLTTAVEFGWELQAWAVMSNHYHLVGLASNDNLKAYVAKLNSCSSRELNRMDGCPGRKVWYRYRDTHLTYEKSYLARLNYVHTNPAKHGIVADPRDYEWCSAQWFFLRADRTFYDVVSSFKTDRLNVEDDYD